MTWLRQSSLLFYPTTRSGVVGLVYGVQRNSRRARHCNGTIVSRLRELEKAVKIPTRMELLGVDVLATMIVPFARRNNTSGLALYHLSQMIDAVY
jgi:hypothetical protein